MCITKKTFPMLKKGLFFNHRIVADLSFYPIAMFLHSTS